MQLKIPRYLVSFDTTNLYHMFTDVLIIGSGIAGLRVAMETIKKYKTLLVSKSRIYETSSYLAQGGIAVAISRNDSVKKHCEDTIKVGSGLCNNRVVQFTIQEGIECVRELVKLGMKFDRKNSGEYDFAKEGGHSVARILHKSDATGKEVQRVLYESIIGHSNLQVMENVFIIDFIVEDNTCFGVVAYNELLGVFVIRANFTVIASGGFSKIYREATTFDTITGDCISAAFRAGVVLEDMEFIQFHPTCLYIAGAPRALISETVRGEGGIILDRFHNRFMFDYHPDGELAPRDILSRAIMQHIQKTQYTNVFLDIRNFTENNLKKRFYTLYNLCKQFNINFKKKLIPIRPAAHYSIGGIKVAINGKTNITNLYACGEVSSTGLHGANRLGSNSLLECLVFGKVIGENILQQQVGSSSKKMLQIKYKRHHIKKMDINTTDLKNSIKSIMMRDVGIIRNADGLKEALDKLNFWGQYILGTESNTINHWELQNMLILGIIIASSALRREESRGTHYRSDFPEADDTKWKKTTLSCDLKLPPIV